jgi:hypothetical protein
MESIVVLWKVHILEYFPMGVFNILIKLLKVEADGQVLYGGGTAFRILRALKYYAKFMKTQQYCSY